MACQIRRQVITRCGPWSVWCSSCATRGETYSQIGNRLARSGRRIQFIESLAEFKQGG